MSYKISVTVAIFLGALALLVIGNVWYFKTRPVVTQTQNVSIDIDPSWIGHYTFNEFASPNETWVYDLAIFNASSGPSATLNINGFQTQISLIGSVQEIGTGTLQIFFESDDGSQPPPTYSIGDLLFSLTKTGSGNAITWGKLQPMVARDNHGSMFISSGSTSAATVTP